MEKLPRGFQVYILAVIAVAAGAIWVSAATISWERWPEMLLFIVLITLASMHPIPNPRGGFVTSTGTLFYVLFCVQNPETTLLVAWCGVGLGQAISRGWVPWRVLFNGAQMALSVSIAGAVFRLSGGSLENPSVLSLLIPLGLASLAHQVTNNLFISWFVGWLRRTSFLRWWFVEIRDYLWSNMLTIPTAALLAVVFDSVHPLTLLLYLVSLPAQRWAIELYLQHRRIFGQAINSLVVAIEASFPQGRDHSRRVADLAVATARQLNLSDSAVDGIELGALVHDVGMIGLEELLESNAAGDKGQLLQHVTIGAEVAREIPRRDVGDIVLFHHEHFDGTGYLGFKGSKIPIGARIVALAEAVESMPRVRRFGSDTTLDESIIKKIQDGVGKQFDPRVVSAFLEATKDNPELLRLSSSSPSSELTVEPDLGGR